MAATSEPAVPRRAQQPLGLVGEAGEMVGFSLRAGALVVGSSRYFAEILRQCSILILGSAVVLVALTMVIGGECGLYVTYGLRPFGAQSFQGPVQVICGIREMFPYMFAYIFAAKVGCGLAAEIGSMRISEEIDALESVGIDPMRYVVATRLVAVWICVPLIYAVAVVIGFVGMYLVGVVQFGEISSGQLATSYWSSQTLADNLASLAKTVTMATVIALVAMYYGYRAAGGPVGVGNGVARSMIVNLVLIHVIGAAYSAIFWGRSAELPFGG